ncbi:hypothetical protein AOCH_006405 [Aspergillus ochraceoroseus]|uniref:Uncharacterized protein n=1 Tax=Aspergillus ochraceoroseus TaxID=138278 RepID=A0A0F8UFX0_9EURO|nr:hypothetical protein AOCH_006405 [Aspergillus ochraceoroseus]
MTRRRSSTKSNDIHQGVIHGPEPDGKQSALCMIVARPARYRGTANPRASRVGISQPLLNILISILPILLIHHQEVILHQDPGRTILLLDITPLLPHHNVPRRPPLTHKLIQMLRPQGVPNSHPVPGAPSSSAMERHRAIGSNIRRVPVDEKHS